MMEACHHFSYTVSPVHRWNPCIYNKGMRSGSVGIIMCMPNADEVMAKASLQANNGTCL